MSRDTYRVRMMIPHGTSEALVASGYRIAMKFAADFPDRKAGQHVPYSNAPYTESVIAHWTPGGDVSVRFDIKDPA